MSCVGPVEDRLWEIALEMIEWERTTDYFVLTVIFFSSYSSDIEYWEFGFEANMFKVSKSVYMILNSVPII